ncbi:hypothetical protein AAC691_10115 [Nguyenibacter vanlangensis]|uniref:PemK-like, MazF-like toxin of type II toxin-antitoxin system n=1 Tax=Nguyenibacter vanlangensis TaxID=1216886 RepID=A0ABZ3DA85_9PROT
MAGDFPKSGQIIDYHYLWLWQADRGETEGRKKRPSCVVLVVADRDGNHVLFIAPITSKEPSLERKAIAIPETEARRANLDTHIPLWVMVDEMNADVQEFSYTLEDRTPRGQFSSAFTDQIIRGVQAVRAGGGLRVSKRT